MLCGSAGVKCTNSETQKVGSQRPQGEQDGEALWVQNFSLQDERVVETDGSEVHTQCEYSILQATKP